MKIEYPKLLRFIELVRNWGADRGLICPSNIAAQYNYVHLELSELYEAVKRQDKPFENEGARLKNLNEIVDGFGDTMVTIIMLGYCRGEATFAYLIENKLPKEVRGSKLILEESLKHSKLPLKVCLQEYRVFMNINTAPIQMLSKIICIADKFGFNPVACLVSAYNEIKRRKGKLIGGDFVKEE